MINGSERFTMTGSRLVNVRYAYILVHTEYGVPCLVDTDEVILREHPMRRDVTELDRRFLIFTETKHLNRYAAHCIYNDPGLSLHLEVWRVSTPTHVVYPCRMKSANIASHNIEAHFASHIIPLRPVKLIPQRSPFFKVEMSVIKQHAENN